MPTPNSNQQVSFTSQLMQNYRLAQAISAGTEIVAVANTSDQTSAVFSITSQGHVIYIFEDPASDTGWNFIDLQFPSTATYLTAMFAPSDGKYHVFAADAGNDIYGINGVGSTWEESWTKSTTPMQPIQTIGGLQCADNAALFLKDSSTGTIYVQRPVNTLYPALGWQWGQIMGSASTPVSDWAAGTITGYGPFTGDFPGIFGIWNNKGTTQINAAVININGDDWPESGLNQYATGPYTKLATASTTQPSADLFAINGSDSGLYYLSGVSATVSTYTAVKISGDVAVSPLVLEGGFDDKGNLEVFALNTANVLYHTRQSPLTSQHQSGWSEFLPLNEVLKFTQLSVAHNPAGYSDVFAVTTTNELVHIWQEPGSDEWHFDKVQTPLSSTAVEEYKTYTVQLTVYDGSYVLAPNAAVQIFSQFPVMLEINNQTIYLDANNSWQGQSNAAGQVTVTMKTGMLGVPTFSVWTTGMPSGDKILVEPSAAIAARLAAIGDQGQGLLNQWVTHSDGSQTPLLDAKYSGDAPLLGKVAQAIQTTMKLAVNQPNAGTTDSPFLHASNDGRIARHVRAGDIGLAPSAADGGVLDQHYLVDFSTDSPVDFRSLTAAEADQLITDSQGLPDVLSFLGFHVDWGDVFNAIKDRFAKVVKFVVSKVTNGVKLSMHLIIDNVEYAWNSLLEYGATFVQKAFDLVQEVFDKVKVSFDHLFGWLAFIFNWDDILLTQQVLSYTLDQMFELVEQSIDDFKHMVDTKLTGAETWISQNMSRLIGTIAGTGTIGQYQAANNTPNPQAAALTSTNFLFTGLVNNANSMQLAGGGAVAARLTDDGTQKLSALMEKIESEIGSLQSTAAFTNAINYFKQMGASPDQAMQMLVSGLLSVIEGLALAAIEGFKAIFDLLCDAAKHIVHGVRTTLEAEWEIQYVGDLFTYVTKGSTLSGLNLMTLVLAIPATAFYKMVYNEAPFQTPADVTTFQQNFTAANILAAWGIAPTAAKVSAGAPSGSAPTVDTWTKFFAAVYSANLFYYGAMDAIIDVQPIVGSALPTAFGWATWICELALLGSSLPSLTVMQGQFNSTPAGISNWLWAYGVLGVLIDLGFLSYGGKFPRSTSNIGVAVDGVYGVIDGLLNFYRSLIGDITAAQIAQNFLLIVPEVSKFLRNSAVVEATEGVSPFVLGGIDVVMDWTVCYINLATIPSSNALASGAD